MPEIVPQTPLPVATHPHWHGLEEYGRTEYGGFPVNAVFLIPLCTNGFSAVDVYR
jgi:hypothetical protein